MTDMHRSATKPTWEGVGLPPAAEFVSRLGRDRLRSLEWMSKNRSLLEAHLGKWVVIAGQRIVAVDDSPKEVAAIAKAEGFRSCDTILRYVEASDRTYVASIR